MLLPSGSLLLEETHKFLQAATLYSKIKTRVLLTHIPLWRPPGTTCGPKNPFYSITEGAGYSYSNMLPSATSKKLLDSLKPSVVFSGDNHEWCTVVHPGNITEYTLPPFSMTGGATPGYVLVSIEEGGQVLVSYCDLPQYYHVLAVYALGALISFVILFLRRCSNTKKSSGSRSSLFFEIAFLAVFGLCLDALLVYFDS